MLCLGRMTDGAITPAMRRRRITVRLYEEYKKEKTDFKAIYFAEQQYLIRK